MKDSERARPVHETPPLIIQFVGDRNAMMPTIGGSMISKESWDQLNEAVQRFYGKLEKSTRV